MFLLKLSREGAELVTANPLNTTFFAKLENIFRVPITIHVTSIDAIEEAIEQGYTSYTQKERWMNYGKEHPMNLHTVSCTLGSNTVLSSS